MNRPFYAFGVLLALLALAMFAVGSSSRSTTVEVQPKAPAGSLITPAAQLGSIYVVVLPAADEPAEPTVASPAVTELKPIQVSAADYDAACTPAASDASCLSHYDPIYDRLIYGSAEPADRNDESVTRIDERGDWLALFHELIPPKAKSARWNWRAISVWAWIDQPTRRGVENLVRRFAERLGRAADSVTSNVAIDWREYTKLMNAIAEAAPSPAQSDPAVAVETTVRSSDWVLHFAVSSLSQMGQTLQRAAAELQRLQFGTDERSGE